MFDEALKAIARIMFVSLSFKLLKVVGRGLFIQGNESRVCFGNQFLYKFVSLFCPVLLISLELVCKGQGHNSQCGQGCVRFRFSRSVV